VLLLADTRRVFVHRQPPRHPFHSVERPKLDQRLCHFCRQSQAYDDRLLAERARFLPPTDASSQCGNRPVTVICETGHRLLTASSDACNGVAADMVPR
jgi:hypothetical protein